MYVFVDDIFLDRLSYSRDLIVNYVKLDCSIEMHRHFLSALFSVVNLNSRTVCSSDFIYVGLVSKRQFLSVTTYFQRFPFTNNMRYKVLENTGLLRFSFPSDHICSKFVSVLQIIYNFIVNQIEPTILSSFRKKKTFAVRT